MQKAGTTVAGYDAVYSSAVRLDLGAVVSDPDSTTQESSAVAIGQRAGTA